MVDCGSLNFKIELHLGKLYVAYILKFGETFKMAIPSQALNREGVETRWEWPKVFKTMVEV